MSYHQNEGHIPNDSKLVGDAGEHFIAYNLTRRGISPALMNTGTRAVDILATINGSTVVSIQVKASWGRSNPRQWLVGKQKPNPSSSFFYAFCNAWEDLSREPEVFIVPSQVVLESVKWEISRPLFIIKRDTETKYKNNWSQIISRFITNQGANPPGTAA